MTYPEAIAIRERARLRQPVNPRDLVEANRVVQETRNQESLRAAGRLPAKPTGEN